MERLDTCQKEFSSLEVELVKERVAKSQPSFSQILHIYRILDNITQLLCIAQQKFAQRSLFQPDIRLSPNVSITFS